jgi:hypothetical protein
MMFCGSASMVTKAARWRRGSPAGQVTLPTSIPSECQRYYCGDGAQMGGASFGKVGGEQADAMRAVDLVGDPLCGG